jgi:hypothetical protein
MEIEKMNTTSETPISSNGRGNVQHFDAAIVNLSSELLRAAQYQLSETVYLFDQPYVELHSSDQFEKEKLTRDEFCELHGQFLAKKKRIERMFSNIATLLEQAKNQDRSDADGRKYKPDFIAFMKELSEEGVLPESEKNFYASHCSNKRSSTKEGQ